ncbi:uncharacterized protein KZ484_014754 isoform 2-T2 [Pholidichthys leucotaenia]
MNFLTMSVLHLLLFVSASFVLACGQATIFTGTEGKGITIRCYLTSSGRRAFFCKGECKKEDILIETTKDKASKGRYTIEVHQPNFSSTLFVTITPLAKSDAGQYKCGMSSILGDFHENVVLMVKSDFILVVGCITGLVLLLVAISLLLYRKRAPRNLDGLSKRTNRDERVTNGNLFRTCIWRCSASFELTLMKTSELPHAKTPSTKVLIQPARTKIKSTPQSSRQRARSEVTLRHWSMMVNLQEPRVSCGENGLDSRFIK